uniref:Conserved plasma membrane protein n=1 Tax=Echinostoma caproni TaxID=27848 RepID=A0A183ALD0_9TREM
LTQYICIDGSSLTNKSIPFEDTERFASNKLTQVVFRSDSLQRDRRPPKAPDSQYTTEFQSDEEISACPHIVQHQPANITPTTDCQFSPGALPTTSDRVDPVRATERCHFKLPVSKKRQRKRKPHTGLLEELRVPSSVLSACLLIVVLLLTFGIIIAFCVINADKLMICKTRSRKRKEREAALASELAEQAAKEAAAAAAAADSESRQPIAWHPIYGRYGMVPPTMGGAFGAFAARTMEVPPNQPGGMSVMQTGNPATMPRPGPGPGYTGQMGGQMQ